MLNINKYPSHSTKTKEFSDLVFSILLVHLRVISMIQSIRFLIFFTFSFLQVDDFCHIWSKWENPTYKFCGFRYFEQIPPTLLFLFYYYLKILTLLLVAAIGLSGHYCLILVWKIVYWRLLEKNKSPRFVASHHLCLFSDNLKNK